ncbi:MAG TPA: TaqI-like C-terminal specificity domain-containing protein [Methanoregulaceae archaeon]|nr:TaqI-like C-terminal specificity domain-containing protein [Methanoregulaceae archaeon]
MEASSQVPEAILKLVEKYEFHQAAYKRGQFNETQLRREFIDPFFRTLGWDVDNTQGNSELYKEVIHEDPIRIRGSTEFIDYAFRIGGSRKFIVEAKKPAVNIKDDAGPALQIRRYAWNARLPLSILTDFEEFAVYDCTKKPMPGDNAATARVAYFTFKEYPEKWGWIESIFSQKSILRGSFDKFAEGTKGKKGTATVDEAVLIEIEEWRDILAKNIAIRNAALSVEELNVAVQKTIDRILFLRICEDRGIEEYGCLQKLLEGQDVYQRLLAQFHRADTRYNSGIFHFNAETGWDEMPDKLTPGLAIDDLVLKKIIKRLYYPESPYEFSVISPVILGQVYEQFLGKVIRLTAGHQAKVEYKPEVKKAGGVYYTPQNIVDYIVSHTVGELVKDKTPREVGKLRVLDPACGSGSFLLGAYQFLLDWHLNWYIHNLVPVIAEKSATSSEVQALLPEPVPKTGKKKFAGDTSLPIYKSANGSVSRTRSDWKLTIAERKRILLNNIYGVDIDTQAVEVTKLSLLLKVLEEESQENVSKQLKLFDERALPSLHQNIKCGNSLIGTDIYTDMLVPLDDPELVKRINVFDWDREFPEIMQRGGFDAVIGNPPYVRQESIKEQKGYFQIHYATYHGTADLYVYFIEKGVSLLRKGGLFSYIVANKWMRANYGKPLRSWLKGKCIEEIVDFGDLPVFTTATTYPCVIRMRNYGPGTSFKAVSVENLSFTSLSDYVSQHSHPLEIKNLDDGGWTLIDAKSQELLKKIQTAGIPLGKYIQGKIFYGIKTGLNKAFVIDEITKEKLNREDPKSAEIIKPFLVGKDIKRYQPPDNKGKYLIFTRHGIDITNYPAILEHLKQFKKELMPRPKDFTGDSWPGRKPGAYEWYEIQDTIDYYQEFEKIKIIIPAIVKSASYAYDDNHIYSNDKTSIISTNDKYLLGLLNSKVTDYVIFNIASTKQGGYFEYKPMYVSQLPIRTIDFSDPDDKARHDKMVALVERMLALHKQKADVKTDHEKNLVERQIEATDKQIDALVYELYGLTEEEIRIVEGGRK